MRAPRSPRFTAAYNVRMDSFDRRPPEPDYRCRRCGQVGTRDADGHLEPEQCITALRFALRTRDRQLESVLRTRLRPPVKTE